MEIFTLLETLEDILENSKNLPFTNKGMVDKEEMLEIIKRNVQKTHMEEKTQILNLDFEVCLDKIKNQQFDIIYLDPPYVTEYILKSIEKIIAQGNLKKEGLMILETDDEQRILREVESEEVRIVDKRKYGRATIIFLKLGIPRKG